MARVLFAFVLAFGFTPLHSQGTITKIAGAPWDFFSNFKSSRALDAPLGTMRHISFDAAGNLYAADISNHLVVKISPAGTLKIIAGTGQQGFSGDGGPATSAALNTPLGAGVDAAGNIFIGDGGNFRIRKIGSDGIITTFAGNGGTGFSGDGGPATAATFSNLYGIAVDASGNVFVADGSNRIRKITPGGTISTVAGGSAGFSGDGGPASSARLNSPHGIAFDVAGNLFIADRGNSRIRKITADGNINTVAGNGNPGFSGDGGVATSATLNSPSDVSVDSNGNLLIADAQNARIRKVTLAGMISSIAGGGSSLADGVPASSALLSPQGVAADAAGDVFVAVYQYVRKISSDGTIASIAGNGQYQFSGDGGAATSAALYSPQGVAVDATGNVFIADTLNARVRKIAPNGIMTTFAGGGTTLGEGGPATSAYLMQPSGVAMDPSGNLFIADAALNTVRKVSLAGTITTVAGTGQAGSDGDGGPATKATLFGPSAVAVDANGNVFIADTVSNKVRKVTPAGIISTFAGGGNGSPGGRILEGIPATSAPLNLPYAVAVDSVGNVFVADTGGGLVRKVDGSGIINTVAGSTSATALGDGGPATSALLASPQGIAVDTSGNLFISDTVSGLVRKVTKDGVINTVAGGGASTADGVLAVSEGLLNPWGLAVSSGNIYIATNGDYSVFKATDVPPSSLASSVTTMSFAAVSGANNTAAQTFSLTSSYQGLPWVLVATTTDGGQWLKAPASGTSPGAGAVSVDATFLCAGTYKGTVTITARGALPPTIAIPVQLVVQPSGASVTPGVDAGGLVNAASFSSLSGSAPGSLVSLFGTNLSASNLAGGLPWPTLLAGTSVAFNGVAVPLNFVSPAQINFQIPWEVAAFGPLSLAVNAGGAVGCSKTQPAISSFSPGIFATNAAGQGAILIANTALLATAGTGGRPATAGDYLSIFATGLGGVTNTPASGAAALGSPATTNVQPTVTIGGANAPVSFSGLAPGFVGLYQVNVLVPAGTPAGSAVAVILRIGGSVSNTVTIAVQ